MIKSAISFIRLLDFPTKDLVILSVGFTLFHH